MAIVVGAAPAAEPARGSWKPKAELFRASLENMRPEPLR
jgi:hypothetical protein